MKKNIRKRDCYGALKKKLIQGCFKRCTCWGAEKLKGKHSFRGGGVRAMPKRDLLASF